MGRSGKGRRAAACLCALCVLLCGCSPRAAVEGIQDAVGEEAFAAAADALNEVHGAVGAAVAGALDSLHEANNITDPFSYDLDSARSYLLGQLQEKYGEEFAVTGKESLVNYGPVAGATYTCQAAPVADPAKTVRALVSQTMYRQVRDDYAVYFFQEEAVRPVLELCGSKGYLQDYAAVLQAPGTAEAWGPEDPLEDYLRESGAYVKLTIALEDGKTREEYADLILDFLEGVYQLQVDVTLHVLRQVQENGESRMVYLFFADQIPLTGGSPPEPLTRAEVLEDMDEMHLPT